MTACTAETVVPVPAGQLGCRIDREDQFPGPHALNPHGTDVDIFIAFGNCRQILIQQNKILRLVQLEQVAVHRIRGGSGPVHFLFDRKTDIVLSCPDQQIPSLETENLTVLADLLLCHELIIKLMRRNILYHV